MDKRIIIVGIVILVIAAIAGLAAPSLVSSPFTQQNITVNYGKYTSMSYNITNNQTLFLLIGTSNRPIDFYVFNATGFKKWVDGLYVNETNGYSSAIALGNKGTIMIFHNQSVVGYQSGLSKTNNTQSSTNSIYYYNKSLNYGDITLVFQNDIPTINMTDKNAIINISYIPPVSLTTIQQSNNNLYNFGTQMLEIYGSIIVFGIIGLGIIIYGLIRKRPGDIVALDNAQTAQIDTLYKDVYNKNKHKRKTSKKTKNKHTKS